MKRILTIVSLSAVILITLAVFFKNPLLELFKDVITHNTFIKEDVDSFNPGTNVGERFPKVDATYNGIKVNKLGSFEGEKATIFVVSRSLVWCPYCMKQMIQLNENLNDFEQAGINIVGLTYDTPNELKRFKDKYSINYPILSDNNAASVKILGILNEDYSPGDEAYGIGHPGAFVIDAQGIIVGKVFIEDYSNRIDSQSLLSFATNSLN